MPPLDRRHLLAGIGLASLLPAAADTRPAGRTYENRLTRIDKPKPLLADHPTFVEPVRETSPAAATPTDWPMPSRPSSSCSA